MPAVNWDKPSTGLVNNPVPSLKLTNDKDGGLVVISEGVGIHTVSNTAEALTAATKTTVTARFRSDKSLAVLASAPGAPAVAGATFSKQLPAVVGVTSPDPGLPPADRLGGIGVAGLTNRMDSTAVLGAAFEERSTGVVGQAPLGTGIRGEGGIGPGLVATSVQTNAIEALAKAGNAAGLWASSSAGPGVRATATAFPGVIAESSQAEGVVGQAHVSNAAGVKGHNDEDGGIGVAGAADNGTGVSATASTGVCLDAQSFNADGIHVDTTNGVGVQVQSFTKPAIDAFSGGSAAVKAGSVLEPAVDAIGVSTGVKAVTLGSADPKEPRKGCGVYGVSLSHAGVCGVSVTGSGILGVCSPQFGFAGRFSGDVFVEGLLLKLASLFSIDHPLEPDRKLLQHATVEAPELKTFYDGVATLDRRGNAQIRLPKWFDALNGNIRYQLTPIGGPAPDLHISAEVKNNAFSVAGGRPGQRVCWQLTGVRHDDWAKKNPIEVECAKPPERRTPPVSKQTLKKLATELRNQASDLKTRAKITRAKKSQGPNRAATQRSSKDRKSLKSSSAVDAKAVFSAVNKLMADGERDQR